MKRRLEKLLLLLVLGAAANVAVAWACAGWAPASTPGGATDRPSPGKSWPCRVPRDWPRGPMAESAFEGFGVEATRYWTYRRDTAKYDAGVLTWSYGWPMRSVAVHFIGRGAIQRVLRTIKASNACLQCGLHIGKAAICPRCSTWNVVRIGPRQRVLGWGPVWSGMVVNTLFYSGALWLLAASLAAARRRARRARGHCSSCGYDITHADHDLCPECGATP